MQLSHREKVCYAPFVLSLMINDILHLCQSVNLVFSSISGLLDEEIQLAVERSGVPSNSTRNGSLSQARQRSVIGM